MHNSDLMLLCSFNPSRECVLKNMRNLSEGVLACPDLHTHGKRVNRLI